MTDPDFHKWASGYFSWSEPEAWMPENNTELLLMLEEAFVCGGIVWKKRAEELLAMMPENPGMSAVEASSWASPEFKAEVAKKYREKMEAFVEGIRAKTPHQKLWWRGGTCASNCFRCTLDEMAVMAHEIEMGRR